MQVYTIPSINTHIYPFLTVDTSNNIPQKYISQSLSFFLQDIKEKIHIHEKEWDNYKKYTNAYEYIHTHNPYNKRSVSKYKPLSRSYFKMIELIHEFQLVSFGCYGNPSLDNTEHGDVFSCSNHNVFSKTSDLELLEYKSEYTLTEKKMTVRTPIRTFHLAEGPGGFIEAVVNLRKNPNDTYIGMTLHDHKNDGTIPTWKKSDYFLLATPNIQIENGADGTGDILSISNFEYCYHTYRSSMDLITADGGFDFSTDFNNQELQIVELLFAQIAFALVMQKPGGSFVLKIFDCFYNSTVDLLALLSSFYKTVYITKPQTSRAGNSEKYVVCKCFSSDSSVEDFYPYLYNVFLQLPDRSPSITQMSEEQPPSTKPESGNNLPSPVIYVCRFLSISIPIYLEIKIEEYNSGFGFYQIENIHNTITLIERHTKPDRIDNLIHKNIGKCIEWCIRYNIPYNTFLFHNTFT